MNRNVIRLLSLLLPVMIFLNYMENAAAYGAYRETSPVLKSLTDKAESSHPLILAARARVDRASGFLLEADSMSGPKITASLSGLFRENDVNVPVNITGLQPFSVKVSDKNIYEAALSLTQIIYSGGTVSANRHAARLAKEAAEAEETRVRQTVTNGVRLAYINTQRARAKETLAQEALFMAKQHLIKAEQLFKSGVAAKSDILRTKVSVAEAEMNCIKAKNAVKISITALEQAVGSPICESDKILYEESGDFERSQILETKNTAIDDYLDYAYKNRKELATYTILHEKAQKTALAARGKMLPQAAFEGSFSSLDSSFFPNENEEWKVAFKTWWTIYDSKEAQGKIRQARAQAQEFTALLDNMRNSVKMEVTKARLNLDSASSCVDMSEARLASANEDYRIADRRYTEGVGTNIELQDARLALVGSKTDYIDAIFDTKAAMADLAFALGE